MMFNTPLTIRQGYGTDCIAHAKFPCARPLPYNMWEWPHDSAETCILIVIMSVTLTRKEMVCQGKELKCVPSSDHSKIQGLVDPRIDSCIADHCQSR